MKIMLIECTAEELRANRTVMDNITEAMSAFTRGFAGFDLNNAQVAKAFASINDDNTCPESEDEEELIED